MPVSEFGTECSVKLVEDCSGFNAGCIHIPANEIPAVFEMLVQDKMFQAIMNGYRQILCCISGCGAQSDKQYFVTYFEDNGQFQYVFTDELGRDLWLLHAKGFTLYVGSFLRWIHDHYLRLESHLRFNVVSGKVASLYEEDKDILLQGVNIGLHSMLQETMLHEIKVSKSGLIGQGTEILGIDDEILKRVFRRDAAVTIEDVALNNFIPESKTKEGSDAVLRYLFSWINYVEVRTADGSIKGVHLSTLQRLISHKNIEAIRCLFSKVVYFEGWNTYQRIAGIPGDSIRKLASVEDSDGILNEVTAKVSKTMTSEEIQLIEKFGEMLSVMSDNTILECERLITLESVKRGLAPGVYG